MQLAILPRRTWPFCSRLAADWTGYLAISYGARLTAQASLHTCSGHVFYRGRESRLWQHADTTQGVSRSLGATFMCGAAQVSAGLAKEATPERAESVGPPDATSLKERPRIPSEEDVENGCTARFSEPRVGKTSVIVRATDVSCGGGELMVGSVAMAPGPLLSSRHEHPHFRREARRRCPNIR